MIWEEDDKCQTRCWQGGFLLVVANFFFDGDKSGGLAFNIYDWHASMVDRL
jgi:hypothetical protein